MQRNCDGNGINAQCPVAVQYDWNGSHNRLALLFHVGDDHVHVTLSFFTWPNVFVNYRNRNMRDMISWRLCSLSSCRSNHSSPTHITGKYHQVCTWGGGRGNRGCNPPPPPFRADFFFFFLLLFFFFSFFPQGLVGGGGGGFGGKLPPPLDPNSFFFGCFFYFFFACQRGWWWTMDTPTLCLENWPKLFEVGKKSVESCPPPISFFRPGAASIMACMQC